MDKKEQDILKKIEEKTAGIKMPDSLSPEVIQEKLKEKEREKTARKKRVKSLSRAAGLAAACLVLVAGVAAVKFYTPRSDSTADGHNTDKKEDSKTLQTAKSYDQIYSYVEAYQKDSQKEILYAGDTNVSESKSTADTGSAKNSGSSPARTAQTNASEGGYSTTNVRQEGVDEGDIAKTDGRYLYVLKGSRQEIAIVDTKDGILEEVGSIETAENRYAEEFYINADQKKLVVICSVTQSADSPMPQERYYIAQSDTEAATYDVSDPSAPKKQGAVTQSGGYVSSRMKGDYIYLFSTYHIGAEPQIRDRDTYVPAVNGKTLPSESIYLPPMERACMYEVVTALDIGSPEEITDSKAIYSVGGELYVSDEHIYFYENTAWNPGAQDTTIRKIAYKDGRLKPSAQGKVKGTIHDSFCMDEYQGKLRMVTTDGDTNAVYILDEELSLIGSIENLAENERVYSARFMGETGYFVTFRETDPLFSVDLSDPEKPTVLGTLKIPGFSEYLHFYGENQLLGIGMDVEEETQTTAGVKLTLFDLTDKADIKEADTYVLKNVYSTDVSYDYKAALIDPEKNMIGFAGNESGGQHYYLFQYSKEEGFQCRMDKEIHGNMMLSARGIYIGQTLYVIQGDIIESYSLEDYKKIDDVIL